MKISILAASVALSAVVPLSHGGPVPDRPDGPCFGVTIQNDPANEADVRQNCDRNVSRTVQVGARNRAQTTQTGSANNNKVRQYHFDSSKYLGPIHRD